MSKDSYLDFFEDQHKAVDHCMWLNFTYRLAGIRFGVIPGPENNWAVCEEATAQEMEMEFLNIVPTDYSNMSYDHITGIREDRELLPFWESIVGMFSVADGDILRFILYTKMPLERLIRYELAIRGYDENNHWCGFERAREIWLHDK